MPTHGPTQLPAFLDSDAVFRTWISGVEAALEAAGLVQTADTGQVNTATVAQPATTNTDAGYQVFRFADALQATMPVFVKITYGTHYIIDRPRMTVQVGTGTNGAGGLTGQLSSARTFGPNSSKAAGNTLPVYASGDGSRIALITNYDASNGYGFAIGFIIDRGRGVAGAPDPSGHIYFHTFYGGNGTYQAIPRVGTIPPEAGGPPILDLTAMQSQSGVEVALAPPVLVAGGRPLAVLACVAYKVADLGELVTFEATYLGATRTFLPMGDGLYSVAGQVGSTAQTLALLWE